MKRKLFSLLIICSLILCIAPPASATGSVGLSPTSFVLQQVSIIDSADPTCPWNNDTTFSSITPLYNLDNTINGYIVKLLTDGEDSGFKLKNTGISMPMCHLTPIRPSALSPLRESGKKQFLSYGYFCNFSTRLDYPHHCPE